MIPPEFSWELRKNINKNFFTNALDYEKDEEVLVCAKLKSLDNFLHE